MQSPRYALISVSDKSAIIPFAQQIQQHGYQILSTGGTAKYLAEHGIDITPVAEITGFPEIMAGRVKTLHPKIHGGLLGRRGRDDEVMRQHGIPSIDLLVLNLYPFEETVARADCTLQQAIENIDIGGPAMLRAAAKNFQHVAVVTEPGQYAEIGAALDSAAGISNELRFKLSVQAFAHVAHYDSAISHYLSAIDQTAETTGLPQRYNPQYVKTMDLRYGENPHQQAAFYRDAHPPASSLANFQQHHGKALSFNNLADTDAAWRCVCQFSQPSCVIVKHANPCGVASAADLGGAYAAAFECDPTSAFGGIIAFNQPLDPETAQTIIKQQFVEVIIAPEMSNATVAVLQAKKNLRVMSIPLPAAEAPTGEPVLDIKRVSGGILLQTSDLQQVRQADCQVVSRRQPNPAQWADLLFAWNVAKTVKSNAIVYARENRSLGIGAGQMSRVDSARIAKLKAQEAGLSLAGAAMASDAFFPFRDGIDTAADAGITSVIQPGGSRRDAEVIAAADEHDMVMVFTGVRHFNH